MQVLLYIFAFSLVGGLLSLLAAGSFLLLPDPVRSRLLPLGVSFAVGALLAASFHGLLPHAFEGAGSGEVRSLFAVVLAGILGFFVLEKLLLWRHCHASDCDAHAQAEERHHRPAGVLILLGDSIHNFVDGVLIAAAFLTDIQLGIVTSLAIAAHEIPQEVGDFAILLSSGFRRSRAFLFNAAASFATVVGGLIGFGFLQLMERALPYFLAIAASSFIYIAVADLLPTLHRRTQVRDLLEQLTLILAGVLLIVIAHAVVDAAVAGLGERSTELVERRAHH